MEQTYYTPEMVQEHRAVMGELADQWDAIVSYSYPNFSNVHFQLRHKDGRIINANLYIREKNYPVYWKGKGKLDAAMELSRPFQLIVIFKAGDNIGWQWARNGFDPDADVEDTRGDHAPDPKRIERRYEYKNHDLYAVEKSPFDRGDSNAEM